MQSKMFLNNSLGLVLSHISDNFFLFLGTTVVIMEFVLFLTNWLDLCTLDINHDTFCLFQKTLTQIWDIR